VVREADVPPNAARKPIFHTREKAVKRLIPQSDRNRKGGVKNIITGLKNLKRSKGLEGKGNLIYH